MATAKKLGEIAWQPVTTKGDGPSARSGHSITVSGNKAIIFGGCGVAKDGNTVQIFNETWELGLGGDVYSWTLVEAMGDEPTPRWRHTATLLPGDDTVLVFGGLNKGMRFNDSYVLSVAKMEWNIKECAGTPPCPRSHHTANLVTFPATEVEDIREPEKSKVAVVGGYGGPGTTRDFYMDVHFLELDSWTWIKVANIRGPAPKPRSDHCTCLSRGMLIVSGGRGWSEGKTDPGFYDDMHCYDYVKNEWVLPDAYNPEDENPIVWPKLPTKLWNHMAINIESVPSDRLFVFGGQTSPREFSNLVSCMDSTNMEWDTKFTLAGTSPSPREDTGCAYDLANGNLIFFGGWRQRWWNDLLILNVAGVVGPPYALQSMTPDTGPQTGGTPITLYGLRFKQTTLVSVRFTDQKKAEATVGGVWISETELQCKSPDFTKFGALDVTVRVSLGGDAYTINEVKYSFYANTQAKRCIAFGPGLLQNNPAGQPVKFIMQAKDIGGKLRSTGNDLINLTIKGPNKDVPLEETPFGNGNIVDLKNGRYEISYYVPTPGKYQVTLGVDENPYDDVVDFSPVRGFTMNINFEGCWRSVMVSGTPAKLRDYVRIFTDGAKIYVVVKDIAKDPGFPDLDTDKKLGFEAPPPTEAPAEGEAEAEPPADEEPAAEEEAPPPEAPPPEAAPPPAEGGADAPPPPEVIPDMIYTLDPATGAWSSALLEQSEVKEMDLFARRTAYIETLNKMGVPSKLARAMFRPKTMLEDWSIEGVGGDAPTARFGWKLEIIKDKLYIYGGSTDPTAKDVTYYDDIYSLDMKAKLWTRIYRCGIDSTLAKARHNIIVGMEMPVVVSMAMGPAGGMLEVVDKLDIAPMLNPKKGDFKDTMTEYVKQSLEDLGKEMIKTNQNLNKGATLQPGDIRQLKDVMSALKVIKDRGVDIQFLLDQTQETINYMILHNMGKTAPIQKKLDSVQEEFNVASKAAPIVRKQIKPLQDDEAKNVMNEIAKLEEELDKHHKKLLADDVFKIDNGAEKSYAKLLEHLVLVVEREGEVSKLVDLGTLFEFPERTEKIRAEVADMRGDLLKCKSLWDLEQMVNFQLEEWKKLLWDQINGGALEEETKTFQKIVKGMDKAVRNWDVYLGIDAVIKNFLVSVPCISELKSPSMRQRHWTRLMQVTGKQIAVTDGKFDPAFCLADMLRLELYKFVDDVGEVVDQANKEDKMEQTLFKLKDTWAVVQFGLETKMASGNIEVHLINLAEENFEMLEENQLVVQGMMASKYLATFEELVVGWQKKLSAVSDVLGQMSETQRKWAYLETLFIGSDEVKKELPMDAERFANVDVIFKELLVHFKANPNCVASCAKDGLLKALESVATDLELCEKALADFLDTKRSIFPRFYFASQVMLLDILSNGNRPWVVMKNINAICQGVAGVKLEGTAGAERSVISFTSNEGEVCKMNNEGILTLNGKVENYFNELIDKMRCEMRAQLGRAIDDYYTTGKNGDDRPTWICNNHIAQLSLVTTQQQWTLCTDAALNKLMDGSDPGALKTYYAFQLEMLSGVITMVQGELQKLHRRAAMNVITLEAHSRDINYKLDVMGVDRPDHFEWLGQLKTRWEKHVGHGGQNPELDRGEAVDAVLYICDALFRYSFEYLGCAGRLVITPLTDRIYITATQSAHLILGCAPQGPAGTGKTESTKDLSAQLGKTVYVFNCGPEMDYLTMNDIFKGLASSGSWGCFDEFNRLAAEVLSVCTIQWKCCLDGMRAGGNTFRFIGVELYLHYDGCMSFITMNPGYLGRQELPESLKVLFRPVTVMVPDFQLIMENMLMSEGYTTAAELGKKFYTLYKLSGDLLGGNPSPPGKQLHYDWGLRAIGSVLKVAGAFLRAEKNMLSSVDGPTMPAHLKRDGPNGPGKKGLFPDVYEQGLLMRALRDFNLSKIAGDDAIVFMGLIKDLFGDVFDLMPRMRDYEFEKLIADTATELDTSGRLGGGGVMGSRFPPMLQPEAYFIANVVDLQDLLFLRHSVFCIGLSGSNKSMSWQTLARVWTKGGKMGKTVWKDLNPKAITPNELYGFINMATREWKDGLLSSTMRDMQNATDSNPKWLILDGDLDANWIENMNSVMDDNRLLTLASNERIRVLQNMKLIFEIRDLLFASPATVTRAGVLYISDLAQWKNYVQSWIDWWSAEEPVSVKGEARKARKAKAEELFARYCAPTLLELSLNYKHVTPLLDFGMVQAITNFLQALWTVENLGTKDAEMMEIYFVFSAVWAFGGAMSITSGVDYRKKFSQYWKDTYKTIKFPHRGEVFDVYVDKAKKDFASWSDVVPELAFDSATTKMSVVTVPTMETVAISFWLDQLLPNKFGMMLIGSAGCGKTAMINGKLRSLPDEFGSLTINISYFTNANLFSKVIEAPLEKKAGKNFGPPGNKKLIYFVDDLNMAALDNYGTASNISLMRQHAGYGHIYDLNKLTEKVLLNTQYLSAMNPTAGSFVINPRLQRLFATYAVGFPSSEALSTIYQTFLMGHLSKFTPECQEAGKPLVQAALQLHKAVMRTFRKTATNFHYEFNVRHMAGVFQGMLMGQAGQVTEPLKLAQLWLHESERVYGDRLVSTSDLKKYQDCAKEQATKFFKELSGPNLFCNPLIFCHFAQGVGDKIYDKVSNFPDLSGLLNGALAEYNETNAAMNLVLFEDAMRHVCRISRIIESSGGHALMVGVGGMGKQSLARLATFVNGFSAFQVVITARYSVNDLKADLQTMYKKSGLKGEGISFIFTDQQIADERFLVFMNDLLSSGNIPGLFPAEDMDDIINNMRPVVKRAGLPDTRDNCWDAFINTVRDNLHVILCFSPIGEPIKVRTRRFPALVNCVVIDWFQPWPEEALNSVSKKFLAEVDLGSDESRNNIQNFMPYSFIAVNKISELYESQERRFNYTTPKSFLELIALYKSMLAKRRDATQANITRLTNGVIKLESTAASVAVLEENLKVKAVEVEAKKAECDAMIPKLEEEKAKAGEEASKANKIASAATIKEKEVLEMKAGIEVKLAAAEPALVAAAAALEGLNVKDLGELKALKKPPSGVEDVTAACICLLQTKDMPFKKIDTSWKAAVAMMSPPPQFLATMLGFKARIDSGELPKSNFANIQDLLKLEHFNVDIQRKKSNAAAGLTDFIININVYNDINENVEPMRLQALQATAELDTAVAAKNAALAAKATAEATVAELEAQFAAAVAEKEAVLADAERCERKLGLAQRLMAALGSEGARWKQGIIDFGIELNILVGDVLLASAFVSYIGCFNKRFRISLMQQTFLPYLKGDVASAKGGVPMSEKGMNPLSVLTTPSQVAGWNNEQLPADPVSTENGAIVTSCARWPLMIDPQLQGIKWIKKHEEKRGLKVVRLGQKTIMTVLGSCIESGSPCMIENIQLVVDAVLSPVIGRQTIKRGRNQIVKLGDKEVDYSPNFKLYLQTKLSNPHYPPEIQAETTLVNFMVTEDGLEDQLLDVAVKLERPDLAQLKADLIAQQNGFKIKLSELEAGILKQLAEAEGDVTENIELIENLEDSKATSIEVGEKIIIAKQTEVVMIEASEMYRPVANRGALMFFLLSDLFKVHTFHFYSLASFNIVFQRAIAGRKLPGDDWEDDNGDNMIMPKLKLKRLKEKEAAAAAAGDNVKDAKQLRKELDERLIYLVDNITFEVFNYSRRGLFDKHKLIVATMLLLRVLVRRNEVQGDTVDYLVSGPRVPNPPPMTAKVQEYLTIQQWAGVHALKEIEFFKSLPEDLELNVEAWREFVEHPKPESEDLPGDWLKKTSGFQKLCIIRALRTDRMTAALTNFIKTYLGDRFMIQPPFDLEDTFIDSTYQTPLFFVLFPGVDPGDEIEALGKKLGYTDLQGNFVSISMGQGQEKNGENVLDRFTREGGWAFLQNVHLMQGWLPMLERKLEIAAEIGHENFRCFVTAEPPGLPTFMLIPEGIMQSAIKVANEPPTDVQSNVRLSWAMFSQADFDKSTKPLAHRPMLFALTFFHALVLGRRKFSTMGFSRSYAFNSGDLLVCGAILQNYLEANEIATPWADVRYLVGEVMYGGHITDPYDRRIAVTYLAVLLNPNLVDEHTDFMLAPGLRPLLEGEYEDYKIYVEEASPPESPLLFGMHPNAEISLLNNLCDNLFFTILSISGGGGGGGGASKEEKVGALQTSILEGSGAITALREDFQMIAIRMLIKDKGSPYVVFVLGELERMNKILTAMRTQLVELGLGLAGALNISDAMDALITAMFMNLVPPNWLKTCGQIGPTGSYNKKSLSSWYADLTLRWLQLEIWSSAERCSGPLEEPPPSVWLGGCFNAMGFLTAMTQVTSRANGFSLDAMRVHSEVLTASLPMGGWKVESSAGIERQPEDGVFCHGYFMEGARWDVALNSVTDSFPKDLYPWMPVIHFTGIEAKNVITAGRYMCPMYTTTIRGPTHILPAPLRTNVDPNKWILASVCMLFQPD